MTKPKIVSGLKQRLMNSVASVSKRQPAAKANDPAKRAVQKALDRENTIPRGGHPTMTCSSSTAS
jgi:hypothetical protein